MPETSPDRTDFLKNWLIKTTLDPHILIVDDDQNDIRLLSWELNKFQCTVEFCSRAKEAVTKILTGAFHLVFIDIKLNNGTGPGVVAETVEAAKSTHFILMSGYLYEDVKRLVDSTAALLFWPKPVTESKLEQILKRK